jgi:glucose/arabinose dehydrogenase
VVYEVVEGSAMRLVTQGFRNPMYGRCHYRDEVCAIDELGDDGGGSWGAREKMLLLHESSNFGYPCCATTNMPAAGSSMSCASITTEEAQMPLNDTPFGLDWERGYWASPYRGGVFVAKHGSFYSSPSWHDVGIWWAPTNAATHAPSGAFTLLVDGFGTSTPQLRRAADVAFAPDGRLFFADDTGGGIYWVAPDTLRSP